MDSPSRILRSHSPVHVVLMITADRASKSPCLLLREPGSGLESRIDGIHDKEPGWHIVLLSGSLDTSSARSNASDTDTQTAASSHWKLRCILVVRRDEMDRACLESTARPSATPLLHTSPAFNGAQAVTVAS